MKREDLLHTGAHKINNALGASSAGKAHGEAKNHCRNWSWSAWNCDRCSLCEIRARMCNIHGSGRYAQAGSKCFRMRLSGAKVVGVEAGSKTLKEAINEAMRDWVTNVRSTHYILGSALGAHPIRKWLEIFIA